MKKDTTKYTDRQKETLSDIARQLEMALTSDKTSQGVKDCLETIIFDASNEAGLPLSDFTLIREAFPKIIEALPKDYGRGIYHSLHAILIQDTAAFKDFYEQRLDEQRLDGKTYTTKLPIVPEEDLITEDETIELVKSILMEADYEHYVLDGLIFLFHSLSELANQNQVRAMDLLNNVNRFIYGETIHCNFTEQKYVDSIHKRYRGTNYNHETQTIYEDIQNEIDYEKNTPKRVESKETI